jgi:hypothetical protein
MTQCRIDLLKINDFVWDLLEYQWDKNIILLIKYKDREGHCNVPERHKEDGKNLGHWLGKQRGDKKEEHLIP